MTYEQAQKWLYEKLPMFQRVGPEAYRKDLHNIRELSAFLGNPNLKFPSVHIAGTNGKGSSSHLLASVLQEAGYHTGLTTSPHLKDFRERIRVNGRVCPETFVIEFVERVSDLTESLGASFFEVSIAMAFEYFAQEKVDIAIVETGLGGRLDSTNIINPLVSVITNIGLDHTQFLGDTLGKIAVEKAGIIKPGVPVVIGESHPETRKVFEAKAQKSKSEIVFAEEKKSGALEMLLTKPITDFQVIMGKYLAGFLLVLFSLIPTVVYYFSLSRLSVPAGNIDTAGVVGSYIGLSLLGGVFTAIGIFSSSVTQNQIIAFILAVFMCFLLYSGFDSLANLNIGADASLLLEQLGMLYHYQAMSKGLLDTRNIIYFLSVAGLMLALTNLVLKSRKW